MYRKDRYARDRVMKSARLLLPHLKDGDTVLDVGCYTQEAKKYYPPWVRYVGVDEKAYHKDTKVTNLNAPLDLPPYQHALCLEVLEHLVNPRQVLETLQGTIPKEGYLVVSLPNEATLFHRLRALLGTVDGECFGLPGKHLHLPSLGQARQFLGQYFHIEQEMYYISPSGCGSRQKWIGRVLKLIPDCVHQWMADSWPSLFARGFIFLLTPDSKTSPSPEQFQPS